MPRPIHRLSDKHCKHAKPGKLSDGGGLLLRTTAQGSSRWVFQYARDGKTREMGLGGYPAVSLAKARSVAEKQRKVLAAGKDPFRERDLAKMRLKKERTFTSVAAEYIRAQRHGWKNRKHARQWCSTLKRYARPVIGELAVKNIRQTDVLAVLKPIWLEKPETAKRVQGRIENILDYATVTGYRSGDNPARWRGYLDKVLLPRSKVRPVRHHPALPYSDIPAFWSELAQQTRPGAPMLRFLILTAMRTSEVSGARWDEIDGDVWSVPAERMKKRRPHRVPLSRAALDAIQAQSRMTGNPHIFAGRKPGKHLSNGTMDKLLQEHMGYTQVTVHGFRSTFRDWAEETTGFPARICEAALAHVVGDKTVAAYQRGDLFEKRRNLMDEWSLYCISGK